MIVRGGEVLLDGAVAPSRVDLRVRDGRVVEVGAALEAAGGEELLDAGGLLVLPGAVDGHVHFDDPGYTEREDFLAGTSAAASGGVTTVIDMPCTSIPPVTSLENLRVKERAIRHKAVVDYGFHGGVCAQSLEGALAGGLRELAPEVLGIKTYMLSGMDVFGALGPWELGEVLAACAGLGLPVLVHAEDRAFVSAATAAASARGSTPLDYYSSRPEMAELLAVQAAVALAQGVGGNLHVVHVGTAAAAELLARRSPRLTAETAPHYLAFDLEDFRRLGSSLKVNPPVKAAPNRERLWRLLAEGTISFVASDHAPCPEASKRTGSIWTDYSGIPGCGTLLPFLYSEGFRRGRLTLGRLADVVSGAAARRYGIDARKGSIAAGKDADLALLDPGSVTVVSGRDSPSRGKVTPFDGMRLDGRIVKTLVRGRVVWEHGGGLRVEPGWGARIRRTGSGRAEGSR